MHPRQKVSLPYNWYKRTSHVHKPQNQIGSEHKKEKHAATLQKISRKHLSICRILIPNPPATFYMRVSGDSMVMAGIHDGDLMITDKSVSPVDGDIVIAAVNGEFTVKRLSIIKSKVMLCSENPDFTDILVTKNDEVTIWGVVTHVIREWDTSHCETLEESDLQE